MLNIIMPPPYLADEIIVEILSRLPAKVVGQCKCISKQWLSLIEDPSFVKLHNARSKCRPGGAYLMIALFNLCGTKVYFYSADYQGRAPAQHLRTCPVSGVYDNSKSVNGIICGFFTKPHNSSPSIFNPTTRQIVTLPPSRYIKDRYFDLSFGYVPSTNEYKVLVIYPVRQGKMKLPHQQQHCEIFTLGGTQTTQSSWRKIDAVFPPQFDFGYGSCCLNGVLHWRSASGDFAQCLYEKTHPVDEHFILLFDLKEERFRLISLPPGPASMPKLSEFGGHLALSIEDEPSDVNDLWVLQDYDNWIWVREIMHYPPCVIDENALPTAAISTGEIILRCPITPTPAPLSFFYYDRKKRSFNKVDISGLPDPEPSQFGLYQFDFRLIKGYGSLCIIDHVENLISF